jgi:tRNA dimethylallyltransferase
VTIRLLVIVGPTASGKTRLGVDVAHRIGSEIVSADSRQVYRGLDIGSGKDLEEYRRVEPAVPCHLIDVCDPALPYSVFLYQEACYGLLAKKAAIPPFDTGVPLLMVGGTGLYVEAVLKGYRIANVPEDVGLRRRLMQREHPWLVSQLKQENPALFRQTDCGSKKRVVRALEIAHHARLHPVRYSAPPPVAIDYSVFGVEVSRKELHRRIDVRLDARLEGGLVGEVQGLLDRGVGVERMAQLGLEYGEVTAYLTGMKTEGQMVSDLRRDIRRLAKRQMTWFRGLPRRGIDVTWVDAEDVDLIAGAAG